MQKHNNIRHHLEWPAFSFHHHAMNDFVELIELSTAVALDQKTNGATRKNEINIGHATNMKNDAMNCFWRSTIEIEFA